MPQANYITDKYGAKCEIADTTARATAALAKQEAEFNRQLAANIYPGRDIATIEALQGELDEYGSVRALLNARAMAGDFRHLRPGDFTKMTHTSGKTWEVCIGEFDPYFNMSDQPLPHHIGMVYREGWTSNVQWNTTNNNNGTAAEQNPYLASNIYKYINSTVLPEVPADWKANMLDFRTLAETRYQASGALTTSPGFTWKSNGKLFLFSETEVYGSPAFGTQGYSQGMDRPWTFFKNVENRVCKVNGERVHWWLRVVVAGSSTYVCYVYNTGHAYCLAASNAGIRPRFGFLLGAE